MTRLGMIIRNGAAILLLAASLIFVYKYHAYMSSDMHSTDDSTDVSESRDADAEMPAESEIVRLLSSFPLSNGSETVKSTFDVDTMRLAIADISSLGVTSDFSLSEKITYTPYRIPDEVFGTYTTVMEEKTAARVQIELYDGKYIIDRGTHRELYSGTGVMISNDLTLEPAYLRDPSGRAMFKNDNGEFFVCDGDVIMPCEYEIESLARVIEYENTADLAADTLGYTALSEEIDGETLFALANADGELLSDYEYTRIYAFSEGLAAALSPDGSLSYLDTDGNVVINGRKSYKSTSDRYVDRVYVLPDTMGPESVGFIYFDGSLVLAREKTVDYVYKENTVTDRTVALLSNGKELAVPKDYDIISAADGVAVVEKDGKYGAFSARGYWVIQPTCDMIGPFYEGLAVVHKDGKCGVWDTRGNEILPCLFDDISPVSGGRFTAYSEECGFTVFEKLIKE